MKANQSNNKPHFDKSKLEGIQKEFSTLFKNEQWMSAARLIRQFVNYPGVNIKALRRKYLMCMLNQGIALSERGDEKKAMAYYQEALRVDPYSSEAMNNIGNFHKSQYDYDKALAAYRRAIAYNPNNALAFCNLGHCYHCVGEYHAELACYDEGLTIDPNHVLTRWNRSLCLLLLRRYQEGWEEYEWRFRYKKFFKVDEAFFKSYWNGQALSADQKITVHTEQGFGDCIQFLRFLPLVKKHSGAEVTFACKKTFHRLYEKLPYVDQIIDIQKDRSQHHWHVPLLSLPRLFNITLDNLPHDCPYIHVPKSIVKDWSKQFKNKKRKKIAICWGGSPTNRLDHTRSIDFKLFWPLIDLDFIDWYSVQIDREPHFEKNTPQNFFHLGQDIQDFADTAAILSQMDFFIGVETAVAHLAGALNIPTWILLSAYPAWRWHLETEDNEWYPSVRLFRQKQSGEWLSVIDKIKNILLEDNRLKR